MLTIFSISLALTLLIELGIALLWGLRGKRELLLVVLVNVLTNPPAVLFYHTAVRLWGCPPAAVKAAVECAAVLAEWLCYRACSGQLKKPFLFSLLANGCSFGMGCLINFIF